MSRRHSAEKRDILPDPRYKSILVAKFVNSLMKDGKKSIARSIVYDAFSIVEEKLKKPAITVFEEAIREVEPKIEVKSRRVGGATYQVPVDVKPNRARALAIRWVLAAISKRSERTSVQKLASEIIDISKGKGASLKTRENTHKMAEANRAFSHYRW
jgi:small subunit ribosomal protein S7